MGSAEKSQINTIKQKRRISRLNPFIALTIEEAIVTVESDEVSTIGRMNHVQLMQDLAITPSSSTETVLNDEIMEEKDQQQKRQAIRLYGIFQTD